MFVTFTLIQPVILNLILGADLRRLENVELRLEQLKLNESLSTTESPEKDAITPSKLPEKESIDSSNLCSYIDKNRRSN